MGGYSLAQLAILVIVIIGVVGVVLIVMRNAGVTLPQWVWQIAGLIALCVFGILAIKFLMGV